MNDKLHITPIRFIIDSILPGYISKYCPKNAAVLDVGCGSGYLTGFFKDIKSYQGIDIKESEGWRHAAGKIKFSVQDATKLKFKKEEFDFVASITSLEHIKDDAKAVSEMKRVLKKGKFCLIVVPTKHYWLFQLGRHCYHHYSKKELVGIVSQEFDIVAYMQIGGLLTFLYTWIYTWVSQAIIVIAYAFGGKHRKPHEIIDRTLNAPLKVSFFRRAHMAFMKAITTIDRILPWPPSCQLAVCRRLSS